MKKLIRVFIVVFCLFFVLLALPGSYLNTISRYTQKIPEYMCDLTLRLAESLDILMDSSPDAEEISGAARDQSASTDKDSRGASEEDSAASGESDDETPADDTKTDAADSKDSASDSTKETSGKKAQGESESTELYYYYTKISKDERLLYDAMLMLAMNYGSNGSDSETRLLETNPSTDAFAESYTRAYNALMRDHPELFWIAQEKAAYECRYRMIPSLGGQYSVSLSLSDASGQETLGEDGASIYLEQQARLEEAADALLAQVDDTQSDAYIALQIHDLLIDNVWYDTGADSYDYAHTAYGALVEDSSGNAGGALCDGYALAYEYLLQKKGITCIVVSGYAGSSEDNLQKHAWNLVRLEDEWYEVDATWDDLDFLLSPSDEGYDLFLEALSDEDYMSMIRHYMFNLTTEQIRSFTPGDEYTYVSSNGWVTLLQSSVHIRSTEDESEQSRDYVTPLAPIAEGTWYTWKMLTGRE